MTMITDGGMIGPMIAEAADETHRCAGSQFDPAVVDAFLAALEAGEILPGKAAVAA